MVKQVIECYLKQICRPACVDELVEVLEMIDGRVKQRLGARWELVMAQSAQPIFAKQSLLHVM
jgi:hypothetical protein